MSLSGTKIRVPALPDGNCGMNAAALTLKYLILNGDLDKNANAGHYKSFLEFLQNRKPKFEGLSEIKDWKSLKKYFEKTDDKTLQKTLALPFREFTVQHIGNHEETKREYSLNLQGDSLSAFKASLRNQLLGQPVASHPNKDLIDFPDLPKKIEELVSNHSTAYKTGDEKQKNDIMDEIEETHKVWWKESGFDQALGKIKKDRVWTTNADIYAFFRFWQVNVNIQYVTPMGRYYYGSTILEHPTATKLWNRNIIDPHDNNDEPYTWRKIESKEDLINKLKTQPSTEKPDDKLTQAEINEIVTLWEDSYREQPTVTLAFVGNNHWDAEIDKNLLEKFKPSSSSTKPIEAPTKTEAPKTPEVKKDAVVPASASTSKPKPPTTPRPAVSPAPTAPIKTPTPEAPVQPTVSSTPAPTVPVAPTPPIANTAVSAATTSTPVPNASVQAAQPSVTTKPPQPTSPRASTPPAPVQQQPQVPAIPQQQPIPVIARTQAQTKVKKEITQTTIDIFSKMLANKKVKPADMKDVKTAIESSFNSSNDVKTENFLNQVSGFRLPESIILKEDQTSKLASLPKNYCPNLNEGQSKIVVDGKGIGLTIECKNSGLNVSVSEIPPELEDKLKTSVASPDGNGRTIPSLDALLSVNSLLQTILAGNPEENSDKNKIKICTRPGTDIQKERIRALILLCKAYGLKYEETYKEIYKDDKKVSGFSYQPSATEIAHIKNEIINKNLITNIIAKQAEEEAHLQQGIQKLKNLETDINTSPEDQKTVKKVLEFVNQVEHKQELDSKEVSNALLRLR